MRPLACTLFLLALVALPATASGQAQGPLPIGAEVALYSPHHRRLVRMLDTGSIDAGGVETINSAADIHPAWTHERWIVVDGGNGQVALYNAVTRRFMRLTDRGEADSFDQRGMHELPAAWAWERQQVVDLGGGKIALWNRDTKRFLRMNSLADCDAMTSQATATLPVGSTWEIFQVLVTRPSPAQKIPGGLAQIAVGNGTQVWGRNANLNIYRWDVAANDWVFVAGLLENIAVGNDGAVWGLGNPPYANGDRPVFKWNGTTWTTVGGGLKQLSVGNAQHIWGVNTAGQVFQWDGSNWQLRDGTLANISVASDGTVWGLTAAGAIYRREGNSWKLKGGQLKQISVGSAGLIWGVTSTNAVYRWRGDAVSDWELVPGLTFKWVSVGSDGTVWGIDPSDGIWRLPTKAVSTTTTVTALSPVASTIGVSLTIPVPVGGAAAFTQSLDPSVAEPIFGGHGTTVYTASRLGDGLHVLRSKLTGDFGAPLSPFPPELVECWDTDHDGVRDGSEDKNSDGRHDVQDCTVGAGCWTGDVAGPDRGSLPDGETDRFDCVYACWDTNWNHTFDDASELSLLTIEARQAWTTVSAAPVVTEEQECNSKNQCRSTIDTEVVTERRPASDCNVMGASRGSLASTDLGLLRQPATRPAGWTAYTKVFGVAGSMYAIDNLGALHGFRGAPDPIGSGGKAQGFAPPVQLAGSGWGGYSSVFGGAGGVIYAVDGGNLKFFKYDWVAKAWVKNGVVIAAGVPARAFGGNDGVIYAQSGNDLLMFLDSARDGRPLPAPRRQASVGPVTTVAGGVLMTKTSDTVNATKFSADPITQLAPTIGDLGLCLPGTGVCIEKRGGSITATGAAFTATGKLAVVTDLGSWDLAEASLTIDANPSRPFISGSAKVGLPNIPLLGPLYEPVSGASAQISMGFGGAFTVSIGTGDDVVQTDPDKFYVYANIDGDIKVKLLGAELSLASYLPIGGIAKGKILFEPTSPVFYADGLPAIGLLALLSNNSLGWWQNPVLGFSLGPCIPMSLKRPLIKAAITNDASGARVVHASNASTAPVDTCGNVMIGGSGSIELKYVTIDLDGTLSVDLDLDNDGKMVWAEAGERNDFAVASDLGMTVSLKKFPLLPKVPVNASVYYQGVVSKATDVDCDPGCSTPLGSATGVKVGDLSQGRIRVTAEAGGSPLVDFMPGLATGGTSTLYLDFLIGETGKPTVPVGSTPEFGQFDWSTATVLGWQAASMKMTTSRIGATMVATQKPLFGLGNIVLTGNYNWDNVTPAQCGDYQPGGPVCLTGTGNATLGNWTLAQGRVKTDLTKVTVEGDLNLGLLRARVTGTATPSTGAYSVSGSVNAGGTWSATVAGAPVSVSVNGLASLNVSQTGGSFSMSANVTCSAAGIACPSVNPGSLTIDSGGNVTIVNPLYPVVSPQHLTIGLR